MGNKKEKNLNVREEALILSVNIHNHNALKQRYSLQEDNNSPSLFLRAKTERELTSCSTNSYKLHTTTTQNHHNL